MRKSLLLSIALLLFAACGSPSTKALVKIEANDDSCWSGNIDGSVSGCGNATIGMLEPSGKFRASVGKSKDDGTWLTVSLIIDGKVVDTAHTNQYLYADVTVEYQG